MTSTKTLICVAEIGAPHGVSGDVRVRSFTETPIAIADYGPLSTEDGRSFTIDELRPAKSGLIVRFAGIDDRDGAEALRGQKLFIPRDRLPPPDDEDEFYQSDLVGLAVETPAGETIGLVAAIQNFGAGDLVEISPRRNGKPAGKTFFVPFTREAVPVVSTKAGRIVVDPDAAGLGEDADS